MSNSLVRTSLKLFGYEDNSKQDKKKRKNRSKDALELIPINHRIIGKTNKKETIVLKKSNKLTVQEAKKRLEQSIDPTEENIIKLLLLSNGGKNSEASEKLINRALKKSQISKETVKPVEPETTLFTEEDFTNFEKEYCEL